MNETLKRKKVHRHGQDVWYKMEREGKYYYIYRHHGDKAWAYCARYPSLKAASIYWESLKY